MASTGQSLRCVNWFDADSVIAYAKSLGKGQTVFRRPDCEAYNITHTARTDRYENDWVVHQT